MEKEKGNEGTIKKQARPQYKYHTRVMGSKTPYHEYDQLCVYTEPKSKTYHADMLPQ